MSKPIKPTFEELLETALQDQVNATKAFYGQSTEGALDRLRRKCDKSWRTVLDAYEKLEKERDELEAAVLEAGDWTCAEGSVIRKLADRIRARREG